jgi:alpha-1,3-mannosyltransferase
MRELTFVQVFLLALVMIHRIDRCAFVRVCVGQNIFAALYILNLALVFRIYRKCSNAMNSPSSRSLYDIPWWIIVLLVVSKRVHSIFMLRMFNDTIAVLFGYIAINCFLSDRFRIGCLSYSLGVSVKMNMLLQAPGVLLVLLLACGFQETCVCLFICAAVQLVLAIPFLTTYPVEYISRSFDLGRVFMHKWTVNFKFLSEDVFVSKNLSILLLLLTILAVAGFGFKWVAEVCVCDGM